MSELDPASLLLQCDQELIHVPGSIQPCCVLVAIDAQTHVITHTSSNVADVLEVAAQDLIGQHIQKKIGLSQIWQVLAEQLSMPDGKVANTARCYFGWEKTPYKTPIAAHAFRSGQYIVLEIEPDQQDAHDIADLVLRYSEDLEILKTATNFDDLVQNAARIVRALTGFDRVMVYRFDADYNGEVVGESSASHLAERFLHQRFPASDIPSQARALYLRKRVRSIVDIDAEQVAILPVCNATTFSPLDLSEADFRSSSPVHIAYLRNMGVQATLVISLMKNDALWGMLSCHHYSPRKLSADLRKICDLVSVSISNMVISFEERDKFYQLTKAAHRLEETRFFLSGERSLEEIFKAALPVACTLVNAQAAFFVYKGMIFNHNCKLDIKEAESIIEELRKTSKGPIWSSRNLSFLSNNWISAAHAWCGGSAVALQDGGFLVVLREKAVYQDIWAGKPEKSYTGPDGLQRLQPRKSFEAWVDIAANHSEPWLEIEMDSLRLCGGLIADALRRYQSRMELAATRRLSRIIDNTSNMVFITDVDGCIIWANEACLKGTGYGLGEILGTKLGQLCSGPLTDRSTQERIKQAMQEQSAFQEEILNYRKDATTYWVEMRGEPHFQDNGAFDGFIAFELDITQRKLIELRLEKTLAEAQDLLKAKSTFLATMSHELRTPLNAIIGFSSLIAADIIGPDDIGKCKEYAGDIETSGLHLLSLITDILDYSRIEAGRGELLIVPTNLCEEISAAIRVISVNAAMRGINIIFQAPDKERICLADTRALQQILLNILSNAVKFSPDSYDVVVHVDEKQNDQVLVSIHDKGRGIPTDRLADVGKPFVQVSDIYSRSEGGTGLGLAITKSLLEKMSGRFKIESIVGQGTSVHFTLPLARTA
jgi:PAS domain S-box-containing protein